MERTTRTKPYLRVYEGETPPKSREDPKYDKDIEIKVGHFVKLCNKYVRFWVEVLEVKASSLKGRIDNDIIMSTDGNEYNDIIEFKWRHIMDHME